MAEAYRLIIYYNEFALGNILEKSLQLWAWEDVLQTWIPLVVSLDKANDSISVWTSRLGYLALSGLEKWLLFLPLISREIVDKTE